MRSSTFKPQDERKRKRQQRTGHGSALSLLVASQPRKTGEAGKTRTQLKPVLEGTLFNKNVLTLPLPDTIPKAELCLAVQEGSCQKNRMLLTSGHAAKHQSSLLTPREVRGAFVTRKLF